MSFATQALAAEHVVKNADSLEAAVYNVPVEIENTVCTLKLKSMGISIDRLTHEQVKYLADFGEGT
jgi:adenosylhomocysteinase